jgi:hypothetical protein
VCGNVSGRYRYSEFFFAGLAGLGILIGIMLNVDDKTKRRSQLNKVHTAESKAADEKYTNGLEGGKASIQ